MRVALMQPTYLGWCGYFNMIDQVDEFILFDTPQFSKKSWQQRNKIRGRDNNIIWLTVPTQSPSRVPLHQVMIAGHDWQTKHWRTIQAAYKHTPHWHQLASTLEPIYTQPWTHLTNLTTTLIQTLAAHIGTTTTISTASSLNIPNNGREQHIADIITATKATHFLEPTGATFLNHTTHIGGAQIQWHNYKPIPYTQGTQPWQPNLSIIDLIAWHGNQTLNVIRQRHNQP